MNGRLAALDTVANCLQLDKTAEQLTGLRHQITKGQIDWPRVVSLANVNLVSPTLGAELHTHRLEQNLPADVRDYLNELRQLNTARNERLHEQTIDVIRALNTIGVVPILLKGAISLFVKTYQDPGARLLTDIDVLVPRQHAASCWKLLLTQGYGPHGGDCSHWQDHHHLQPLSRSGEYATIEIHHEVLPPAVSGRLLGAVITTEHVKRITRMFHNDSACVSHGDLLFRVPSPTARILHCILHSAFMEGNAYRSGVLPLRSLYELALLQSRFEDEIDWGTISRVLATGRLSRVLRAWVYLAHRLYGSTLPHAWSTTPGMHAHYARCRLQARWGLSITLLDFKRI